MVQGPWVCKNGGKTALFSCECSQNKILLHKRLNQQANLRPNDVTVTCLECRLFLSYYYKPSFTFGRDLYWTQFDFKCCWCKLGMELHELIASVCGVVGSIFSNWKHILCKIKFSCELTCVQSDVLNHVMKSAINLHWKLSLGAKYDWGPKLQALFDDIKSKAEGSEAQNWACLSQKQFIGIQSKNHILVHILIM